MKCVFALTYLFLSLAAFGSPIEDAKQWMKLHSRPIRCTDPVNQELDEALNNFTLKEAKSLLSSLEKIAADLNTAPSVRSEAYRMHAGVAGIVSRKLKSAQWGGVALENLQTAIKTDSNNARAVSAYAMTICRFTQKSSSERWGIESIFGLNISIKKLAVEALDHLDRLGIREQNAEVSTLLELYVKNED